MVWPVVALGLFGIACICTVALYTAFVTYPERKQYCKDLGYEYIDLGRSWACRDKKTGQLFK